MKYFTILALLLAAPAGAQVLYEPLRPVYAPLADLRGAPPAASAVIDWSGCAQTVTRGPAPIWARTSTETAPGCAGLLATSLANVAAVTSDGVAIYPPGTQVLTSPEAFDAEAWVAESDAGTDDPSVTAGTDYGYDGTAAVADSIAFPAVSSASAYSGLCQVFTATAARWSVSVHLKSETALATNLYVYNGATYYRQRCTTSAAFSRCILRTPNLTADEWKVCIGTDLRDAGQAATDAGTVVAWGAQGEATDIATPYRASGGNAGDTPRLDPFSPRLGGNCVAIRGTAQRWTPTATRYLWSWGNAGSNSSAYAYLTSGGSIGFDIKDAAGRSKTWLRVTHGMTDGTEQEIAICWDNLGGARFAIGGTEVSLWNSGAGASGVLSAAPTRLWIGNSSSVATALGGVLRTFKVCRGTDPTKCRIPASAPLGLVDYSVSGNPYAGVTWATDTACLTQIHDHPQLLETSYRAYDAAGYCAVMVSNYSGDLDNPIAWTERKWPLTDFMAGYESDAAFLATMTNLRILFPGAEESPFDHFTSPFNSTTYISEAVTPENPGPTEYTTTQQGVDLTIAAGGLPMLAHPWGLQATYLGMTGFTAQEIYSGYVHYRTVYDAGADYHPAFRALWDAFLTRGTVLWGIAVNDWRGPDRVEEGKEIDFDTGKILVWIPTTDLASLRSAIVAGAFVAIEDHCLPRGQVPQISAVAAAEGEIALTTTGAVKWIGNGAPIGVGSALSLERLPAGLRYARAEVSNACGVVYVQPFSLAVSAAGVLP